ncbi:MAG TPA: hypothetical protein VGW38_25095, partial [Chloroflexota bacterium]|nr:hypothetical protein [Chloroflexota bacterium]
MIADLVNRAGRQSQDVQQWGLLGAYVQRQWRGVLGLAALVLAGIALQLASPQVLRAFIDAATTGAPLQLLSLTASLFLVVAVG